ncbi:PD-(D/E)XK nuclease family protein [Thalassotalea marina]|uniref:PD-(D/E)XK nuclease superfamily protein n=1 Tax=Thalassotalea marina TaxID=1673741 RepID=A0A919EPD8_9GAMM|nr:PD-(D/E)XK nuclease family protein [Thalassotalea marina]GHG08104.1 hypothetical protein GCM10017161_42330 [Thalassotalea marina]
MTIPNLFSFATSELSQDAFICWFLTWAKSEHAAHDLSLHHCARQFITKIFLKHAKTVPSKITDIKVTKQDRHIDVLCVINNKYPIIIEDKTGSENHSDQLRRYVKEIEQREFNATDILPIYYKTEEQSCYSTVLEHGYQVFLRDEMIEVLEQYEGQNQILLNYRDYLIQITAKVKSFLHLPISEWGWHSWQGFYSCVKNELRDGNWDYIANPRGGFIGFWWHWLGDDKCQQYLQLEEEKLCFKIWVAEGESRTELRSYWHQIINKEAKAFTELDVKKPDRFGNGHYMTVCINSKDYRVINQDNTIDFAQTVKLLRSAEQLLNSVQPSI